MQGAGVISRAPCLPFVALYKEEEPASRLHSSTTSPTPSSTSVVSSYLPLHCSSRRGIHCHGSPAVHGDASSAREFFSTQGTLMSHPISMISPFEFLDDVCRTMLHAAIFFFLFFFCSYTPTQILGTKGDWQFWDKKQTSSSRALLLSVINRNYICSFEKAGQPV